jgi:N-acetylneuraminic acid mutarotase
VLVAGGANNTSGTLSSAELYDSTLGVWSTTGALNNKREVHTATLLPNGNVLVVGGFDGTFSYLSSAELYVPTNGTWTTIAVTNTPLEYHTATLLPNGKVLIAGGYDGISSTNSAELYDPGSGTSTNATSSNAGGTSTNASTSNSSATWTNTGTMNTARDGHTATLLANGQVLVAGGYNDSIFSTGELYILSSTELYDPDNGSWTDVGALNTAREGHSSTLLPNGKVLVAGGYNFADGALSSTELYDPAAGTWATSGSMSNAREYHTATLLPNGLVLVAGGYSGNGPANHLSGAELFDPATGTWKATGGMNVARANHTATLFPNGEVAVAGGANDGGNLTSTELYDPATRTWRAIGILGKARASHTATLLPSGQLLVTGGEGNTDALAGSELFDVGLGYRNAWQPQISFGTNFTGPHFLGSSLVITGAPFRGISEGSGGNAQSSPADHPVLQLRNIESGQILFLNSSYSLDSDVSTPVINMPIGWTTATMFVNGIPSPSILFNLTAPGAPPVLLIKKVEDATVLSWTNRAFSLQFTPKYLGQFTPIPGATSPYTNPMTAGAGFFRLIRSYQATTPGSFP